MSVKFDEVSYQLNGRVIAGIACGNIKAKPVLCLHGWLDNAASFIPLMSALSADMLKHNRFIAIDWPGHGQSSHRSHDAHYHFFDYVYDLVELFELNNWATLEGDTKNGINIIAHSMGAMVASAFTAAFPEKVKSLTLIDSLGFICVEADQSTSQLRKGLLSRLKTTQVMEKNTARAFSKETAIKARLAVSDLTPENANLLVSRSLVNFDKSYRWRSDPRLRTISPYRITNSQAQQLMADIHCAVLLIYGDKGMAMVLQGIDEFSHRIKNLAMTKVKGGHHVHMEQPTILVKSLSCFWLTNKN
jgi:pimeloyl-ACP methyl ester carboxylesterase